MKKCLWILVAASVLLAGRFTGACSAADAPDREIIDKVVANFMLLAQVPRPSHHEKGISDFLAGWGRQQGFEVRQDKENNVRFDLPATPGYETLPLTILQGHMDMVCVAADGVAFDPLRDTIRVIRDDQAGTLTADGTSLGGDDGAGVAMIMLAAQGGLAHGPLRIIITTNEEDGMTGAFGIDPGWLEGAAYLINLDNETSDQVLVSTAAGDVVKTSGTVTLQRPAGDTAVLLELRGLRGGHSGVEIDKGRCNGLIAMARLLKAVREQGIGFDLVSLSGGSAPNAISSRANAAIMIRGADKEALKGLAESWLGSLREKFAGVEDNVVLQLTDIPAAEQALSGEDRDRVIAFLDEIIDGVNTWSADMKGLVESSSNLGLFRADKDGVAAQAYVRSSVGEHEEKIIRSQRELAEKCGYQAEAVKTADPWPFKPGSRLLELTKEIYKELNGTDISVVAVHAGLECGTFAKLNPAMDMISIGPDLKEPHSPNETLYLASVPKTWNLLKELLIRVK